MIWVKTVTIADNERGMLFKHNSFQRILVPGRYRFLSWAGAVRVETYDITSPKLEHVLGRFLVTSYASQVDEFIDSANVADNQVGLVYQDKVLTEILRPGSFRLYWKGAVNTEVKVVDISENFEVEKHLLAIMGKTVENKLRLSSAAAICYTEVPDSHVGLLTVNGKLVAQLKPGHYGYWRFGRNVAVALLDCRLQTLEVSGQEILTKDRVSLRINLSASFRIVDSEKVATMVRDYTDFLYRAFQLVLREAVGTRSLDELLADKDALNEELGKAIKSEALDYGLQIQNVGVKDIILPGDMKEILNQVVEAQKAAEANQIKRREETHATRSLHNTAKVMEGNPVLLRLKELEMLEKVADRIDRITVYGGLEGVMQDLVKIPVNTQKGS